MKTAHHVPTMGPYVGRVCDRRWAHIWAPDGPYLDPYLLGIGPHWAHVEFHIGTYTLPTLGPDSVPYWDVQGPVWARIGIRVALSKHKKH
jgi:hypothetical protein